jgi:hypothetical protein
VAAGVDGAGQVVWGHGDHGRDHLGDCGAPLVDDVPDRAGFGGYQGPDLSTSLASRTTSAVAQMASVSCKSVVAASSATDFAAASSSNSFPISRPYGASDSRVALGWWSRRMRAPPAALPAKHGQV